MTKQFEQLRKEVALSDMSFWQSLSSLQNDCVFLLFSQGRGIKKQYKRMMQDEEKISEIELFI